MEADAALEQLMSQLGDFGKFQFRQHVLHLIAPFLAGLHMLTLVFVAPTPTHRCYIDELDGQGKLSGPTFDDSVLQQFIPRISETGHLSSCKRFDLVTNASIGCTRFVYDDKYYKTSRVIEWNLVCDERWQRAMIQSIYMFGVLMGAIILGSLADKYGRKPIFCISGILQLIVGFVSAFIPSFIPCCIILFFYGMFASGGAYVTSFVLSMELVGPSKRTYCGTAFSAIFAVGVMVVAVWAFLIPDVKILQIVYSLHSLLLLGHWWLIDESIRWLWGQGRHEEAIAIVKKGIKINGGNPADLKLADALNLNKENGTAINDDVQFGSNSKRSYGAADLFKKPTMCQRTIIVAFLWFTNSLVYYGLSLNAGSLEGNPFLILFLLGLVEAPGYLIVILAVDRTGRRCLESALLFIGGSMCLIAAFSPAGLLVTSLVMVGKMAIAGSFAIIYNYTAELFPTVVRNSAVGVGASSARFSGMLTPLISLLDSLGTQVPGCVFGSVALIAAVLSLLLPETLRKIMPQTIEDGENFGRGDTGFRTCLDCVSGKKGQNTNNSELDPDKNVEARQPLSAVNGTA